MNILKKQTILALILSAAALLSVSAAADEAEEAVPAADEAVVEEAAEEAAAEEAVEEIVPPVIDGMERIIVTSSDSSVPGTTDKVETSVFFDGSSSTGCTISFIELPAPETDENGNPIVNEEYADLEVADSKTFSIYTATRVPEALQAVAALFGGESGTVLGVSVYATNDSLLMDWTQLTVQNPVEKIGEYDVFTIAEEPVKYSFYRIDIEVIEGAGFDLSELVLYKPAVDEPEYAYVSDGEVEAGETPDLIEVSAEEPVEEAEEAPVEEAEETPLLGLFGMPGLMRQTMPRN